MENDKTEDFAKKKWDTSVLFIIFDINKLEILEKIKKIKELKEEKNKDKDKENHFELILIVKENNEYIKETIDHYKLGICYLLYQEYKSNFKKIFGNFEELDSKCIFINKNMKINLIL